MSDSLWAILLTVLGGVVVKVVEKFLPSREQTANEIGQYRKDLREDNKILADRNVALNDRIDVLEREIAIAQALRGTADSMVVFWRDRAVAAEDELKILKGLK